MTGPELKTCPFCGVRPHVHDDASHSTAFFADCYNDNCTVQPSAYGLSKAEAIAAWNTRASVDYAALPEIKALIDAVDYIVDGMGISYPDYELDPDEDYLDAANAEWVKDTLNRLAAALRAITESKA